MDKMLDIKIVRCFFFSIMLTVLACLIGSGLFYPRHAYAYLLAERILILKKERQMMLLDAEGRILKTYKIALGAHPEGRKTQEGDEKTPEGLYTISGRNEKAHFTNL